MTINERMRYIRTKILKLNQTEFANTIGMKQTGISTMERPGATVSDQAIKATCAIHGISELWIREEKGSLFASDNSFDLVQFVKDRNGTELELEILKAYFELDVRTRQHIIEHFKERLSPFFTKDENIELNSDSSTSEMKTAEEEYIKSRLDTAKKMASSALNTTEEGIGKNSNLA